ncbi:lactonase family protein [Streptomyces sp. NPDC088194]|uniref:lactonase family protein n=1 Tax=Streptomyces sp. NPDC088194 TaxID=3154931 RepID=UPI00344B4A94
MPDSRPTPTGRPPDAPVSGSRGASAGGAPHPSRRLLLGSMAATAAAAVPLLGAAPATAAAPARRTAAPRSTARELVYVNTWKGTQIHGAWFDPDRGDLTPIGPVGEANADWAVTHPTLPILYVATMAVGGVVDTFRIDPATGALAKTGELSTGGTGLNGGGVSYIGIDQPSNTLLATNFEDGFTAAVPISRTGELAPPASLAQDTGSGPNPRQASPHPHHAEVDPSGRFALVADFGADRVFVYRFDRATRTLSAGGPAGPYAYPTAPGSGPRRVAFHPDGRTVYLLSELSSDLQTLRWDPHEGELTHRQTLALDGPDFTGTKSASDLAISGDGRFVYAGNRGENSLTVFAVDPRTDLLSTLQSVPCGGTTPWGFTLHPSGRWLLVANEASNTVNVFGVDRRSGKLTDTGMSLAVPNPDSVTFFRR